MTIDFIDLKKDGLIPESSIVAFLCRDCAEEIGITHVLLVIGAECRRCRVQIQRKAA